MPRGRGLGGNTRPGNGAAPEVSPEWALGPVLSGNSGTWVEIPDSNMTAAGMDNATTQFLSYSGGSLHPSTLRYYMFGGGHADDWQNGCYSLNLAGAAGPWGWTKEMASTPYATIGYAASEAPPDLGNAAGDNQGVAYYPDGKPASRHTWGGNVIVVPELGTAGRVVLFTASSVWGDGNGSFPTIDAWDISSKQYTWINPDYAGSPNGPNPTLAAWPGPGNAIAAAVREPATGDVWALGYGNYGPYRKWSRATQTWVSAVADGWSEDRHTLAFDSTRNRVVSFPSGGSVNTVTTFNSDGTGLATTTNPNGSQFSGTVVYSADLDRFVHLSDWPHEMNLVHPTTFVKTLVTQNGWTIPSETYSSNQPHSRFFYVPAYKGVCFFNAVAANVRFMRLAS